MLQELTFVDSVLLITVFDLAAVCGKFSCTIVHAPEKATLWAFMLVGGNITSAKLSTAYMFRRMVRRGLS